MPAPWATKGRRRAIVRCRFARQGEAVIVEQPGGAASWSSRLLGGEATDADQVSLPATRAGTGFVRPHAVGDQVSSVLDRLGMARGCWAVELQQEAGAGGLLTPGRVPKAEVRIPMKLPGYTDLKPPGVPISKRPPFQSQTARDGVVS